MPKTSDLRKKIVELVDFPENDKDLEDNWKELEATCDDYRSQAEEMSVQVDPPDAKTIEEVKSFHVICSVHCTKYRTFVRKKKYKEKSCHNCKCEPVCKVILRSQQSLEHYHTHGGSLDFYEKLEVLLAEHCDQYIPV